MKADKTIYARATPKSIELTETYFYEKEISLNSSLSREKQKPDGKIKIVVPYDGHNYLTSQAIEDVKRQIGNNNSSDKTIKAVIGYLAISKHDGTNVYELLDSSKKYDSVPLEIPLPTKTIDSIEKLKQDKDICVIKHKYHPKSPNLEIVKLDIKVFDDDSDLIFDDDINLIDMPLPKIKNLANKIEQKVSGFSGDNKWFRNKLIIQINIQLTFPESYNLYQNPQIDKISIRWPKITFLNNLNCIIGSENNNKNLKYNPLKSSLEWKNREKINIFTKEESLHNYSDNQRIIYHNVDKPIFLVISSPGELYQQASLEGEIEIEIPETLLSGLKARYYKFDNQKAGLLVNNHISKNTRIINNFELILDDVFQKRTRTISQELKFDKIFLDDECIRIIKSELETQGFEHPASDDIPIPSSNDKKELKCLIYARRSEGIENMFLWIVARGKQFQTIRETTQGDTKFKSQDESGELKLYLLGRFTGNNHILLQRMNALQKELRKKFEKIQREK